MLQVDYMDSLLLKQVIKSPKSNVGFRLKAPSTVGNMRWVLEFRKTVQNVPISSHSKSQFYLILHWW